jgi:hypothetical protein
MPSIDRTTDSTQLVLFARSEIEIARPSTDVGVLLGDDPARWLAEAIEGAGLESVELLRSLGANDADHGFPLQAAVRTRKAIPLDGGIALAVDWTSAIFPAAELELQALPLGPTSTRIELSARLTVPSEPWQGPDQTLLEAAEDYTRRLAEQIGAQLLHRGAERVATQERDPER